MSRGRESKPHIGIFGRRNNGKSSVINALTGQDTAIVSDTPGTTTDPVKKSMEIQGIGPVVLVDTAGIDDVGELGKKRIAKTIATIKIIDLALLIIVDNTFGDYEKKLADDFREYSIPFIVIHNKSDDTPLLKRTVDLIQSQYDAKVLPFCALNPSNKEEVVQVMKATAPPSAWRKVGLLGDVISRGELILLITPIDTSAPEARMILPQVQTIRDILDNDCVCVVAKENDIESLIKILNPRPSLVITDSQVFRKANDSIPADIPLTSFSIILARQKGDFENYIKGTPKISELKDGDRALLLESCTHHVSCEDIGRVKIPNWLNTFTGKRIECDIVSGLNDLHRPIDEYSLVIQCGGCMITQKQLQSRLKAAIDHDIPVTNYGMAIAWMHGIFERAVAPFVKTGGNGSDNL